MIRRILNQRLVRSTLRSIGKSLFSLSNIVPKFHLPSENEAIEALKQAGFKFDSITPPNEQFVELQPNELDLSIVIPVYNAEKFLSKCLESVVEQQTKYTFEVICVNDGSTDRSLEILKHYADKYPRLVKVINQKNAGISAARNKGIEAARGRYVGFMDNDDYVGSKYIESCMERAIETNADIVQPGLVEERPTGEVVVKSNKKDALIENVKLSDKPKLSGYVWNGVIRKSLFDKIRFPHGFWFEDMIMVMLLFRVCKGVAVISNHLYHKLVHENNASRILWRSNNIKAVERYWLAKSLSEYGHTVLNLPDDEYLYHSLLYEFGTALYRGTTGLPGQVRKAVFSLCAIYLEQHRKNIQLSNKYLKKIEEAYIEKNYYKYVLTCLASRLS